MSLVQYDLDARGVGILTLNDPDNLNAMGEEMAKQFREIVSKISASAQAPRVLILTGAGRAFSAGGNLNMLEDKSKLSPEENRTRMLDFYNSFLGIIKLPVPLIAAINGPAIGAGLCVACACDIRIAAEKAKLGFTFTRLGLHPGMAATYFLPRVLGEAVARELLLTGRVIEASEALRVGLVSQVVAAENLINSAKAIADEILLCGPESVSSLVQSLRSPKGSLDETLQHEAILQSYSYASDEFKEGVRAAIEKRKAKFVA